MEVKLNKMAKAKAKAKAKPKATNHTLRNLGLGAIGVTGVTGLTLLAVLAGHSMGSRDGQRSTPTTGVNAGAAQVQTGGNNTINNYPTNASGYDGLRVDIDGDVYVVPNCGRIVKKPTAPGYDAPF